MSVREARCNCGQLRAEVDGDPVRVSVCHCLACQRRTGSAFGVQARFAPEQVTVLGESRLWERTPDEGDEPRRYWFCPTCGATVLYDFGAGCGLLVVPVGAFADPDFPAPSRFVWTDRRHAWVTIVGEDDSGPGAGR